MTLALVLVMLPGFTLLGFVTGVVMERGALRRSSSNHLEKISHLEDDLDKAYRDQSYLRSQLEAAIHLRGGPQLTWDESVGKMHMIQEEV